jgi:hypothetical protein
MNSDEPRRSAQHCSITVTIDDADSYDRTTAIARMDWRNHDLEGVGRTRASENFPDRHSEQLAISRALSDLIAQLDNCAPGDVGAMVHHAAPAS